MPISQPRNLAVVGDWLIALPRKPASVLDVGIGTGLMGAVVRQYVDYWCEPSLRARHTVLHGIEGHYPYVGQNHYLVYDRIMVGEALALLRAMAAGSYHVCLAVDILEHFEQGAGIEFLQELRRVGRRSLVLVPYKVLPQGAAHGNELEVHRTGWPLAELAKFGRAWADGTAYALDMQGEDAAAGAAPA